MTEYERLSLMLLERIATSVARIAGGQHAPPMSKEHIDDDLRHLEKVAEVTKAVREALNRTDT